jgi:hypothetical protein
VRPEAVAAIEASRVVRAGGQFGDEGFEEVRGGGAGSGELRFQLVHQGHQLIHFGHDPALFGEGWDEDRSRGERHLFYLATSSITGFCIVTPGREFSRLATDGV